MANPYTLLGVSKNASQDEIKQAYRKLARKMHPDLNPNDKKAEDRFKEVTTAYDILSDPEKRRRFDNGEIDDMGRERAGFGFNPNARHSGGSAGGQSGFQGFEGFNFDFSNMGGMGGSAKGKQQRSGFDFFSDMFASGEDMFPSGRARRNNQRSKMPGTNVNYDLSVSFMESISGATKEISLSSGKTLSVQVPPGTADKAVLRLKGQGTLGLSGGAPGDALVKILVQPHPYFTRQDMDILLDVPVTLKEAVLGAKVTIPTLEGKVALTVPANSNSGAVLRLRGKGVKTRDKTGDLLARLVVTLPPSEDAELRKFVENWSCAPFDPRAKANLL